MHSEYKPVELHNQIDERLLVEPMYFKLGFSSTPQVYARAMVLNGLLKALDVLPNDYGFLIWDVYRPRAVQARLFAWMCDELRRTRPELSDEENKTEARKYMSPPSQVGDEYCPPHLSGGAVDLTLFERHSKQPLLMGTEFDECTERAHRDYFKGKTNLTALEEEISTNRDLLRQVLESVGFTSYQYEWWHFDMGNMFWSQSVQKPALFGPLFGDNEWPDGD